MVCLTWRSTARYKDHRGGVGVGGGVVSAHRMQTVAVNAETTMGLNRLMEHGVDELFVLDYGKRQRR